MNDKHMNRKINNDMAQTSFAILRISLISYH